MNASFPIRSHKLLSYFARSLPVMVLLACSATRAEERLESFDRDPNWDGYNNRATKPEPQQIRQDFGYSQTRHCGGAAGGEMGGLITPAREPAYYAKRIPTASFAGRLVASGKFAATGNNFHVLLGFFNAETINEWRTPNTIVFRLYGRGDVFYAYVEYCTSRWRAGGDSPGGFATVDDPEKPGKQQLRGFKSGGAVHTWSIDYNPDGNSGQGQIVVSIDDQRAVCNLDNGHKADGATFNRFGLLSIPKSFDGGGEVWLDDIAVNGQTEDFSRDPMWDAVGNRRTYMTNGVRPRFDFGFSDTQFAGGKQRGELGGIVFRGDNRYPDRLAYYGDRLQALTLDKPLRAAGKVALRRGVSDSTSLIGFFNAQKSVEVSSSQDSGWPIDFLGAAVEGPSREGFLFYPAYRVAKDAQGYAHGARLPHILPDGKSHDWSLEYQPPAAGGAAKIVVQFDRERVELEVPAVHGRGPATFDRFGIITTWIDGNSQDIYFDDLRYTWNQQ
jgi:hypothetical protein